MESIMSTDEQSSGEQAATELYLTFLVGAERFAMPVGAIREIINFSTLTEIPLMPDFLPGVLSVRGTVVPVIDLALRLGMDKTVPGRRSCVIILDLHHDEQCLLIGLLVDLVHAVLPLIPEGFEPLTAAHDRVRPEFLQGMMKLNGRNVISLDLQQVLDPGELVEQIGHAGFPRSARTFSGEARRTP